jgi:hypothetical protein
MNDRCSDMEGEKVSGDQIPYAVEGTEFRELNVR